MTKNEYLLRLYREYARERGEHEPVSVSDLADWAMRHGRYEPPPAKVRKQCERDFAAMFRQRYVKNEEGEKVRVMHAVRMQQSSLWDDVHTISRKMMETSLRQRRQQVVHDCYQMKVDAKYYNDRNLNERPIQLVLDFTVDVVEMEMVRDSKKATPEEMEANISLN